MTATPDFCYS